MVADVTTWCKNYGGFGYYTVSDMYEWTPDYEGGGEDPGYWRLVVVEDNPAYAISTYKLSFTDYFMQKSSYVNGQTVWTDSPYQTTLTLSNGLKARTSGTAGGAGSLLWRNELRGRVRLR